MTSRNSFFNLLKEDLQRRLWTLILSTLVFFGTFGVAFTMIMQNYVGRYSRDNYGFSEAEFIERISGRLCEDFYGCWPWFMFVAIVGAIICGMNGFAYLHSRKQMDFYHSLPVKRETIFFVRLVNGILIYAAPYLAGLLYTYLLCAIYRVMTWDIFFCGLFFFLFHLMGYVIMYLGTILAMMLTGKLVIGFFGLCIINLYAPAVYALAWVLEDTFFVTSYSNSMEFVTAVYDTRFLSPGCYYGSLVIGTNELEKVSGFWLDILIFLVLAAVLVVLNLWLYKKRASEKADTAMAFPITEPIARMLISVPVGVLAGMIFYSLQYDYRDGASVAWLIFGGLLGGFLCHGIMEAFYKGDIKKCLSHKGQMAVTMVLSAIVPLVFLFDVFGYDSYLPKKKDIKSMAVISNEMRFGGTYYDEDGWISATNYALENMHVNEIDAMYELAEILAGDAAKNRTVRFFNYSGAPMTTADMYYAGGAEKMNYTDFIVRYTLKDGSEVIRTYEYDYYAVMDLLERIYNNDEYKSAVHPIFGLLKNDFRVKSIETLTPTSIKQGSVQSNCKEIMEAYEEDLLALSFNDLKNSAAIGEMNVYFEVKEGKSTYEDSTTWLLYPGMTRTLELLKQRGITIKDVQTADHVKSISVSYGGSINDLKRMLGMAVSEEESYYDEKAAYEDAIVYESYDLFYEKYGYYPPTVAEPEYYKDVVVEFTDPAEINSIKKCLVNRSYTSEFGPFPEVSGMFNAEVYFEMHTGTGSLEELLAGAEDVIGWSDSYRFREDRIPQFVIDRIFEALGAKD